MSLSIEERIKLFPHIMFDPNNFDPKYAILDCIGMKDPDILENFIETFNVSMEDIYHNEFFV